MPILHKPVHLSTIPDELIVREAVARGAAPWEPTARSGPAARATVPVEIDPDDVAIDDFDDDEIEEEAASRGLLPAEDGSVLAVRLDFGALDAAAAWLQRGDRAEALIHLERALGPAWAGRLAT